jgi:hypothetical protein
MTLPSFLARIHRSLDPSPQTIKRPRRALGTWTSVNEQIHSSFLTTLPAEIRNQIYIHLFTTSYTQISADDTTLTDPSPLTPNPLAILLTCRKIYLETALLAFSTHTFHITGDSLFSTLRTRTSHLPSPFFDAITFVSFTPETTNLYNIATSYNKFDNRSHAEIISNVILLFPALSRIDVRMRLQTTESRKSSGATMPQARWFWAGMAVMYEGWKAGVWKRHKDWEWKYMNGGEDMDGVEYVELKKVRIQRGQVSAKHCAATLSQKSTNRQVRVYMVLADEAHLGEKGRLGMVLEPGMEGVGVEEARSKKGSVGFRYDPGEMYWGDLKNRKELSKRGVMDRGRDEEVPRVVEKKGR